jgi:hypothetical protein
MIEKGEGNEKERRKKKSKEKKRKRKRKIMKNNSIWTKRKTRHGTFYFY